MQYFKMIVFFSLSVVLISCDSGPESPKGFSLPKGDAQNGKVVFMSHKCLACHKIEGIEDPNVTVELDKPVFLGGSSPKVTTYAELVTSIINPSHKIARQHRMYVVDDSGQSIMRNYNDVLTVTELVDLVTFLQPHYKVKPTPYTPYSTYYIP